MMWAMMQDLRLVWWAYRHRNHTWSRYNKTNQLACRCGSHFKL